MTGQFTIATRGSKLALWQANHIADALTSRWPGTSVRLEIIKTTGDKILDVPLARVGGKGLFVKEIEEALLDGRADLAVHSMKDVPAELPEGLILGVIPERESPYDCLVSASPCSVDSLPRGARLGTSSLRRMAQIKALRPDLEVLTLRGNLDTRVGKALSGEFDAIIVARAGLNRLGISAPCIVPLSPPAFLPAVGQGALGIEYHADRSDVRDLLAFLDHPRTRDCVAAERSFLHALEGGCQVPIAGYAVMDDQGYINLTGRVAELDGSHLITRMDRALPEHALELGRDIARQVLHAGGREILQRLYGLSD